MCSPSRSNNRRESIVNGFYFYPNLERFFSGSPQTATVFFVFFFCKLHSMAVLWPSLYVFCFFLFFLFCNAFSGSRKTTIADIIFSFFLLNAFSGSQETAPVNILHFLFLLKKNSFSGAFKIFFPFSFSFFKCFLEATLWLPLYIIFSFSSGSLFRHNISLVTVSSVMDSFTAV